MPTISIGTGTVNGRSWSHVCATMHSMSARVVASGVNVEPTPTPRSSA